MVDAHQFLQHIFESVAPVYESQIVPAFGPMAASLVEWIQPRTSEKALDIGTGTGVAARLLAPLVDQVTGVDFAPSMIREARHNAARESISNIRFVEGNVHILNFPDNSFDLVIASFGFNATNPHYSLPEVRRVLKSGGRFFLQEWGGIHLFDTILDDVFAEYAVDDDDAPAELVGLRDFLSEDSLWYKDLQTVTDYEEKLAHYGFTNIYAEESTPVVVRLPVNEFIAYKTVWLPRTAELKAMDTSARRDCLDDLRARYYEYADAQGILAYAPRLFRARAYKPTSG